MKAALLLFFITLATATCPGQKPLKPPVPIPDEALPPPPPKEKTVKFKPPKMSVEEKLESYLSKTELKPWFIVNNPDPFNEQSDTTVGGHRVKWSWSHGEETRIDIDGDLFSLKDKISLNNLEEGGGIEKVDFANIWDQIKLYDIGGRQLIGISMVNHPCTGIGCSVSFFLIYDLKTKTKSFFGSYRIDHEVKLYDFGNDGSIDFLSGTYSGGSDGVAKEIANIHELYKMDEKGGFQLQLDKTGKKFFFKRTFEVDYKELEKKFVQNWVEEIK